jgi:RimJ/RimL family protein N-acetyltransferase
MFVASNQLILRKLIREYLLTLQQHKNTYWMDVHQTVFVTMDDQDKWFNNIPSNAHILTAHPDTGKGPIGLLKITDIHPIHRSAWIGQDVWTPYQGMGYGAKIVQAGLEFCFEVLNLHRIQCEILESNAASRSNYEKNGFVFEGKRRRAIWKPGGYQDSLLFGLLKDDYANTMPLFPTA